jgi:hypothetical protein
MLRFPAGFKSGRSYQKEFLGVICFGDLELPLVLVVVVASAVGTFSSVVHRNHHGCGFFLSEEPFLF